VPWTISLGLGNTSMNKTNKIPSYIILALGIDKKDDEFHGREIKIIKKKIIFSILPIKKKNSSPFPIFCNIP
jgi:hypothetical protein